MKIVLVHPPGSNWVPGRRDITATANRMAPLGLLSIAAFLRARGHVVAVYDCLGPGPTANLETHTARILALKPELAGFSATTAGFLDACQMAGWIKALRPEVFTLCGGVHPSALGAALLADFPAWDALGCGEGELTLAEVADGRPLASIQGLVWREDGRAVTNPPRTALVNLDELPFPAYDLLAGFPKHYHLPLFSYIHSPGATLSTSRGCLYQCSYCDRSVFKQSYRYNSADYVYDHLHHLHRRFKVRHVNIYDDLFTTHRRRILTLCEKLQQKPLKLHLNCAVRVGHADDELLQNLKAAGFLQVSLGIESAAPDLLRQHKPGVQTDAVARTVTRIQAAGLRVKGLFMMGLPGETVATIRKTTQWCLALGLDDMNMSKFTPFPGAPLWSSIHEWGQFTPDWRLMNCLNFVFIPHTIGSRNVLDDLYNQHVQRFYSDRAWRRKFMRRFWQHRHSLLRLIRHAPDFWAAKKAFE